ncbi:spermadhesin Z13-like, partial [Oryx dammah]|uniref:spermadhesin Z13-like n=1 Tax=Oryx dammah TaxID=59534 RepID=UPI001A9C0E3F
SATSDSTDRLPFKDKNVCGDLYEEEYGVISPYLGLHTECRWTIRMDPGYKIVLEVRYLYLNCDKESFEIIDGPPESSSARKFCGISYLEYASCTNTMTIKYTRIPNHPVPDFLLIFRRVL